MLTYRVVRIQITSGQIEELAGGQMGVGWIRIHVKEVIKPVVVKIAFVSICFTVGAMFRLIVF